MSSNIRRTVESAQGVLAGFFGKEHLIDYGEKHGPVQIHLSDLNYNILVPDTRYCEVLRKNNHSAMVHPDFLPGFKEQRLEVEAEITKFRDNLLKSVIETQSKVDAALQHQATKAKQTSDVRFNKHRQHYLHNPALQPLYEERGRAIARVDRFWPDVLNRDPDLQDVITRDDMKALIYLRSLEVEQFEGMYTSGYRIHFTFDRNPYFYNTHLCKEVFTRVNPVAPPSTQTVVKWKPGWKLIPDEVEQKDDHDTPSSQCASFAKPPASQPTPKSFFHWFSEPSFHGLDSVSAAITGDIWRNPLALLGFSETYVEEVQILVICTGHICFKILCPCIYAFGGAEKAALAVLVQSPPVLICGKDSLTLKKKKKPVPCTLIEDRLFRAPKLCLYSSHDSTMTGLMEIFSIWNNEWPPFASDLRLELYREVDSSEFYIRVLFNGQEQRIRGQTESYMHWPDFCNAIKDFTIQRDELKMMCDSDILEKIAKDVLKHEKWEVETKQIRHKTETPAGM
ncbi:protein set [Plakobranchus ocellatus]|uniref:Protein set n=1 Tax=Plakobranchus ocellatus TaxID=259542 RepID=A0AAV3YRW3_9GAST|nr:protein set [Plakobranchus ocellatus]